MIKDPATSWKGPFPYDVLAEAGVTPQSTAAEVNDSSFALMRKGRLTPTARAAWNELRDPAKRLVADFLLYDVDPRTEIEAARFAAEAQAEITGRTRAPSVPRVPDGGLAAELLAGLGEPVPVTAPDAADLEVDDFPPLSFISDLIRFDK